MIVVIFFLWISKIFGEVGKCMRCNRVILFELFEEMFLIFLLSFIGFDMSYFYVYEIYIFM